MEETKRWSEGTVGFAAEIRDDAKLIAEMKEWVIGLKGGLPTEWDIEREKVRLGLAEIPTPAKAGPNRKQRRSKK